MTCVWEPDPGCLGTEWDEMDEALKERALLLATSSLVTLTLGRVGTCPITIRPCPQPRPCGCDWTPYLDGLGQWRNGCGCASFKAACAPLYEIDLPGPVGYIESIKVDGQEIDLTKFRLDNGHLLVWQGVGPSPIPATQDLNKPDTEPGTWSITYSRSHPVGPDGRIAVAALAMEFAKACSKAKKCGLPKGVTSVVRNGVSFTVEAGLFPGGLTGIEIADQFILKWAPAGAPSRNAVVFNPRTQAPRRTGAVPTYDFRNGSL